VSELAEERSARVRRGATKTLTTTPPIAADLTDRVCTCRDVAHLPDVADTD
jgi:hypothetical protein